MKMEIPLTGFINTDAIQEPCPRCGAKHLYPCRTPSGRRVKTPHIERMAALIKRTGLSPFQREQKLPEFVKGELHGMEK